MTFKNFKSVDKCVYGRGSFNQLREIMDSKMQHEDDYFVFLVDDIFKNNPLASRLPVHEPQDKIIFVNVDKEPTTLQVDSLTQYIHVFGKLPAGIIGIGGGSVMDIAKAVSLLLTNEGSAVLYQGLNLIKNPGIYKIGIPTLGGTGAEVSMTAVLTGPTKKLGIKCDYTMFDQIILDPELINDAPINQRFYTGMDSYIHCVESLTGTKNNTFSKAFAEKALELCQNVFCDPFVSREAADDKLMIASYMGGLSLTYSEVGVCHALSYGLSFVFGTRHGIANCMAFEVLDEVYGSYVKEFRMMVDLHQIRLPKNLANSWTEDEIARMTEVAMALEHMWIHAYGNDWKAIVTKEKISNWYKMM
ncbi:MAG: iron-containing alcohol dehydrogenase [Verrucomicrobia bacterium]|nr:iron-containing alcohol dehydrogenase [Cytophagales bacterium]